MMMSPESYYEFYLKGKTAEEIMTCIRSLKNEIGRKKKLLENPYRDSEAFVTPSPKVIIAMDREYLEYAKKAYAEAGGVYNPSQPELRAERFDEDVEHIHTFKFSIGGFCTGDKTRIVTVHHDSVSKERKDRLCSEPINADQLCMPFDTREEFLEGVRGLHLGEWRHGYFDWDIIDGIQWDLEITFVHGRRPFKCAGSNAFPYNFDDLCELMGCREGDDF